MNDLTMTSTVNDALDRVSTTDISEEERYRLLADDRRRAVLDALADLEDETDVTSLGELASAVDRAERRRVDADETPSRGLLVDLHHVHLPLIDDVGLVDYEPETKRIHIGA